MSSLQQAHIESKELTNTSQYTCFSYSFNVWQSEHTGIFYAFDTSTLEYCKLTGVRLGAEATEVSEDLKVKGIIKAQKGYKRSTLIVTAKVWKRFSFLGTQIANKIGSKNL